ncbi:hypothetical protein [Candidatus Endomicrobiellum devescovinae]|jgi:hypothetical protein|uniref:hypothetical protein n=1 Tax=Candidatus Endomicrobiellum devescovinae TaxID=3242322 RepID=UPI00282FF3BE|nr:hypothetical protein [Endomicrobium sp.]
MAKFITRSYTDQKTGKIIKKNFRVDDNYELRNNGGYDEDRKQKYTEAFQDQPGMAKTLSRAALPSVVGAGLGAIAKSTQGGAAAGKAASALGGTALASAANAFANYQNRVNPKSKAAAVGSGALSTAANAFAEANQRSIARGSGAGASALSGLGAGLEGALKGGLSMLPGGSSLGQAASPLLGGIFNAINNKNPAALLSGLAGAAGSVLSSKTLGQDMPQWFRKSEAKDYAGGTWGQGSDIEDLSDEEQAKSNEEYLTQNQPSVRSDMPTDFDGTAQDWMSDANADTRQDVQEQNQMDTYNDKYQEAIDKGGTEAEAAQAGVEAQRYQNQPAASLEDIDDMTGGQFKTPQETLQQGADSESTSTNEDTESVGKDTTDDTSQPVRRTDEQNVQSSGNEGNEGNQQVAGAVQGGQGQVAPQQQQGQGGVVSQAGGNIGQAPAGTGAAQGVGQQGAGVAQQLQQTQQPPAVQSAQNLPMPNAAREKVPAPPPPPPAPPQIQQQPAATQSAFATGFSSPAAKMESEAKRTGTARLAQQQQVAAQINAPMAAQPELAAPEAEADISLFGNQEGIGEAGDLGEAGQPAGEAAAGGLAGAAGEAPEGAAGPVVEPKVPEPPAAPSFSGLTKPEGEDGQYKWGRGEVPSFFPKEDLRNRDTETDLMPNYEGKSQAEIDAESQRLMAEQEEYLRNASPQGSTNYYNENANKYEFLSGYGYLQEKASQLVPQTVFSVQGDADYEAPNENDSITDNEGRIFIRTPLGMLQVGDKSKKPLSEQYRLAVQRIAANLSLNESEPSEEYIKDAEDLYNQLPADVKGFSETPSRDRKEETLRNVRMSLSSKMNERSLKEEMTKLTDNAKKWNLRAKELDKLRQIYKARKKQLRESKYGKKREVDDWAKEQVGLLTESERQEAKTARIQEAREKAERGVSSEGLTNRQKIEYLRQQELVDLNRELPYRDRLKQQYSRLEEEAKHLPELQRGTPESLRRDAEMRRLQNLITRIKPM